MIKLISINETEDFIKSGPMRLLYFSNENCGVCHVIKPKLNDLLKSYPLIESAAVDLELLPELCGIFSIFTIPGILLFINGKETIREARYISMNDLKQKISRFYNLFSN